VEFIFASSWAESHARSMKKKTKTKTKNKINVPEYVSNNLVQTSKFLVAELRRPEGALSGAPYSYRKEKETHELIFSWLS